MIFNRTKFRNDFNIEKRSREINESRHITFKEISESINITRITLHGILTNNETPKIKDIAGICSWMNRPIEEYIFDDQKIFVID